MTEQQPPLWEVMYRAYDESSTPHQWRDQDGYAAEIRALADWLVPEEPEVDRGYEYLDGVADGEWNARRIIRNRLMHEADRAESDSIN